MAVMECGIHMQEVPEDEYWRSLVFAIINQAIQDVQTGYFEAIEGEAAAWLLSTGLQWLAGLGIDIDPKIWAAWVEAGCPIYQEVKAKEY